MNNQRLSTEPDPLEWLRFAESDLNAARKLRNEPDVLPNSVAFHAQQAVEKAIKALLIRAGIRFPFTHDLQQLFDVYRQHGHTAPFDLAPLNELSPYAGHRRYPGWIHQPGAQELQRLLSLPKRY